MTTVSGLWWSLDRRFIGEGPNALDAAVQDVAGRWWSRDGSYRWDGSQWRLVDQAKAPPLAWSKSPSKLKATTPTGWADLTFGLWEEPTPDIRGESYHQNVLIRLFGLPGGKGHHQLVEVQLTREPGNPHDSSAVKALIASDQIGHLAREHAAILGPKMDAQGILGIVVPGLVLGAFDEGPNYGVRIWGRRIIRVISADGA